tara:strand:+ start:224 stop:952 length:729 start_codon:yes stop_codon:yes gene_type:complete
MIVIILAAGKGTRLYPLTKNKPKCLVKYKDKTILSYQLDVIKKCGLNNIYIVTGFKSNRIKIKNVKLKRNKDYKKTNMVYSLFTLKTLFNGKEDLIISYGDIIYKKVILKKLVQSQNSISTVIDLAWFNYWKKRFKNPLSDAESLKLDKNGNITEVGKKVNSIKGIKGQYIGLTKFKKDKTKDILNIWNKLKRSKNKKSNLDNMYFTDLLNILINKKFKIKAVKVKRGWLEFDNKKDLTLNF